MTTMTTGDALDPLLDLLLAWGFNSTTGSTV
jgi:hypothetical protein